MKFSDLLVGESFELDHPDYTDTRFVKISSEAIKLFPDNGLEFTLCETDLGVTVKNVGQAFECGQQLRVDREGGLYFQSIGGNVMRNIKVSLTDIVNAGFANNPHYACMLILLPADTGSHIELVWPVKRIDKETLELALKLDKPEIKSRVRVKGDEFFVIGKDGADDEIELEMRDINALEHFLSNGSRYARAKTLAEHELDYVTERQREQLVDCSSLSALA